AAQSSLRAGEFLPALPDASRGQIETDSEVAHFPEQSAAEQTNPLKELEPMAAAVDQSSAAPPLPDEPKGLEWHLKARGVVRQPGSVLGTSAAPSKPETPQLLGYDRTASTSDDARVTEARRNAPVREAAAQKQEAQLFSSYVGDEPGGAERSETRRKV